MVRIGTGCIKILINYNSEKKRTEMCAFSLEMIKSCNIFLILSIQIEGNMLGDGETVVKCQESVVKSFESVVTWTKPVVKC